jgi:hypothetical protein
VSGGINTVDRQGDIVGAAAIAQFDQHLEIELVGRPVEAAPQRLPAIADTSDRVLFMGDRVGDLVRDHHLHGLAGVAPPGQRGAEELRMQRGAVERHPQQRHLGGEQAPSKFVEAGNAVGRLVQRAEQPVGDVIDRVMNGALLRRARHSSDDTNMLGQKRGRSRLSRCVARRFRESADHRPQTRAGVRASASGGKKLRWADICGASRDQHRGALTPCPCGRSALGNSEHSSIARVTAGRRRINDSRHLHHAGSKTGGVEPKRSFMAADSSAAILCGQTMNGEDQISIDRIRKIVDLYLRILDELRAREHGGPKADRP